MTTLADIEAKFSQLRQSLGRHELCSSGCTRRRMCRLRKCKGQIARAAGGLRGDGNSRCIEQCRANGTRVGWIVDDGLNRELRFDLAATVVSAASYPSNDVNGHVDGSFSRPGR